MVGLRSVVVILSLVAGAICGIWGGGCDPGVSTGATCSTQCASGCCDGAGRCREGNAADNCGAGGRECKACGFGESCVDGVCLGGCSSSCDGCCDDAGNCRDSADATCGSGGALCKRCGALERCREGRCLPVQPSCGPSTCLGCCRGNECVAPSNTEAACGGGGRACAQCSGEQKCAGGVCRDAPCTADICASGCCFAGECHAGDAFGLCGGSGGACASCVTGQQCAGQVCVSGSCSGASCSDGCCDGNSCHPAGPTDPAKCGKAGRSCKVCSPGQVCEDGVCVTVTPICDPVQCAPGCCDDNDACVPGTSDGACGNGGQCAQCGSSQQCVGQQCACTSSSCSGCCDGGTCKGGATNDACGSGGGACDQCIGDETCLGGQCKVDCSQQSCPTGCCDGSACNPQGPTDAAACGVGGVACKVCDTAAGQQCLSGTCNNPVSCGPGGSDPCLGGCCDGGVCQAGTASKACGLGGSVCEACQAWGECVAGVSDRFCDATDGSSWQVVLSSVVLDKSIDWDGSSNPPEIYVVVTVGGTSHTSSTAATGYQAQFNELLLTASGADLKAEIKYVIWDSDPFPNPDDKILECSDVIYPEEFTLGFAQIDFPCGSPSSNPVESIRFELTPAGP